MNDKEFDRFLKTSVKELNAKQDRLIAERGMGSFDNFEVDLKNDELTFFRGKNAFLRAKILMVGTHVEEQNDWLWAWANSGLPKSIRTRSDKLKALAKVTGEKNLAAPNLNVDGTQAWELLAMACKHLGALGAYTFPNRDARIYVLIVELEDLTKRATKKKKTTKKAPRRKRATRAKTKNTKKRKKTQATRAATTTKKKNKKKKTSKRRSR